MIITVTLNPAVDQTMFLDRLTPGDVYRVRDTQLDPAGKGVNASRVAHRLGWPTIAFAFVGGETGLMVAEALDEEGVQRHFVRVGGQTRINITVVEEETGRATSLWGPGPPVDAEQLAALEGLLRFWFPAGRAFVAGVAIALARGDDLVEGLRLGTAAGAATAMTPGTALGNADDIARLLPLVEIEEIRT